MHTYTCAKPDILCTELYVQGMVQDSWAMHSLLRPFSSLGFPTFSVIDMYYIK